MVSGADRTSRDVGGAVGGAMVLFIAFALIAVILLSSTVLSAVSIKNEVRKQVNPAVQGINSNLNSVPLLDKTNAMAGQIMAAAKPLSNEAGQIVSATSTINDSVTKIHDSATAINGNVHAIDGRVTGINSSLSAIDPAVSAINSSVSQINTNVGQINGSVSSIGSDANAISASVGPINSSVHGINGSFTNLLPVTSDIRGVSGSPGTGVAGIDNRVDIVIGAAGQIKGDTTQILSAAGTINSTVAKILAGALQVNTNADKIQTSALLNLSITPAALLNLLGGANVVCGLLPTLQGCPGVPAVQQAAVAAAPKPAAPAPPLAAAPPLNTALAPVLNPIAPILNGLGSLLPGLAPNTTNVPAPNLGSSANPQSPSSLTSLLQGLGFGL